MITIPDTPHWNAIRAGLRQIPAKGLRRLIEYAKQHELCLDGEFVTADDDP